MKEIPINLDVLIIGGGPSGCAAALTLLNKTSLDVAVIESTNYSDMRIGESVSPSIIALMRYLGVESEFLNDPHIPSHGIDAAWGSSKILSRNFFFTGQGNGWNLDRQGFDRMLAEAVKKRNGLLLTSTNIIHSNKNKRNWSLVVARDDGSKIRLNADFVIDASGKNASFARCRGAKWQVLDYLVGIACLYEAASVGEQSYTLLESAPNGWWYSTLLPNNKRIVVFMTDSDIARRIKIQKNWNNFLKKTLHVQKTVSGASLTASPNIFPAYSQLIKKTEFSDWVPAGDAVASFDPLSSMGIGHALVSGIQAARVAHNALKSDGTLLNWYFEQIAENFKQYLKNRSHFYSYEKRWKNSPFWKRRQTKPDLSFQDN